MRIPLIVLVIVAVPSDIRLKPKKLAQAGVVFNDSTRLLDGGLWSSPADNNNQQAYLGFYTTDINAVLDDINTALVNPSGVTINGNAYALSAADTAVLSEVQGQLQTLLTEAPLSVGNSHQATAAQELINITQTDILSEINGDNPTELSALESAAGETGSAIALTTVHLETGLNQIIVDIVQNDTALNLAAGANGTPASVGGFAEFRHAPGIRPFVTNVGLVARLTM